MVLVRAVWKLLFYLENYFVIKNFEDYPVRFTIRFLSLNSSLDSSEGKKKPLLLFLSAVDA